MRLDRSSVDLALVPFGLLLMLGYHLFLLFRVLRHPETTVVGYEDHNKRAWVARMLRASAAEVSLAKDVISANISAASSLASICIALSSLIAAWVGSSSSNLQAVASVIYGDTSSKTTSVKFVSLLVCFMVAFAAFIQATSQYVHANFLITTLDADLPVEYVQRAVLRGGHFWSAGLRALYMATALLFWFFGPIPMLACSACFVATLYVLDGNKHDLHHFNFNDSQNKGQGRV